MGQAFAVLASRAGIQLLLFALFLYELPTLAWQISKWAGSETPRWSYAATGVYAFVILTFNLCLTVAGTNQYLSGGRFVFTESLQRATRRFLPMLGTLFLVSLLLSLPYITIAIVGALAVLAGLLPLSFYPYGVLVAVGLGVFLVAVRFLISTAICVIENSGPITSIKRSFRLTKTHPWRAWRVHIVVLAALLFFAAPLLILLLPLSPSLDRWSDAHWYVSHLVFIFLCAAGSTLPPIINTALLLNLRRTTGQVNAREIATVFE